MLRCLKNTFENGIRKDFFGDIPFVVDDEIFLAVKMQKGELFDVYLNEFFYYLRKDSQKFLESGEVFFKYGKYGFEDLTDPEGLVDMFTKGEEMILRVRDSVMLDSFLLAYRQSDNQKKEFMEGVVAVLKDNADNCFNPQKARKSIKRYLKLDIDIPLGPNKLAPDYKPIKDTLINGNKLVYHFGDPPAEAITKIKYTSVLDADFRLAYKKLGLTSDQIKEAEKLYVWHHLDDFDPVTGEGTMQLVLRELHNPAQAGYGPSLRHTGGTAMWRKFYFPLAPEVLNYEL